MPETTTIELLPPADSEEAEAEEVIEPAPTEAVEQSPEEPPAAAPKKRGRPAGAKNKAKPPTTVSTPPVAPVAPVAEIPEIELPPPAPKAKAKAKTKAKPKPKARSEPVQYESESEEEPTPRTARRNAWSAFREHQAFEHAARRDAFERRISMFMN